MILRHTRALSLLAATATAPAVVIPATAAAQATAPAASVALALRDGQGVRIARSVFIDDFGQPHDTADGVLLVSPAVLERVSGVAHGFLHVVTAAGPVAYNIPFDAEPDAHLPPRLQRLGVRGDGAVHDFQVPFGLSSADPIPSLGAKVVLTDKPILDRATFDAVVGRVKPAKWLVQALPEAIGGDGPGAIQAPPLGPLPPPPPGSGSYQAGFNPEWQFILPNPENVNAAKNQCVPAALANAIAYLDATYGFLGITFPQQHVPGVGFDGDEDSLVSRMDWYTDRIHTDTCIGEGTSRCGEYGDEDYSSTVRGIFEYLAAFDGDQKLRVSHQDSQAVLPAGCGLDEALDRESQREGAEVTFAWLCDRVQDGASVVMSFGYYDELEPEGDIQLPGQSLWDRTGGHMVRVIGCGEVGGRPFIRTLDDGQQNRMVDTDADEVGDLCEIRDGLRQQLWFVDFGSIEGRMLLGSNVRQIEFALALTPDL